MHPAGRRLARRAAALALLALMSATSILPAQGPATPADLEARLKQLDEQNKKLQQQLDELKSLIGKTAPPPVVTPAPATIIIDDPHKAAAECGRVEAIVSDILARKEAQKEADKQKKDKEGWVVGEHLNFSAKWDHGLWLETEDKAFRIHLGGRTQFDSVWMDAPFDVQYGPGGTGRMDDAVAFRRGRLAMEGTLWEVFQFNMEYDFVNTTNAAPANSPVPALQTINVPVPTDLWIQIDQLPIAGHLRIGNLKPPISFEHITSSRFLNFMERSMMFDFLVGGPDNGFDPGVQVFDTLFDKRMYWSAAVTKNNQSIFGFNVGDGEWAYTFRLTGLPVWLQDGRVLVHMGLGYQVRETNDNVQRVRARTDLRNGPAALHTPLFDYTIAGDVEHTLVPEFVVVAGPWTFQSEYYGTWITNARNKPGDPSVGTAHFWGYYAELLYMLTGEHRAYDRDTPRFGRVVPYENFFLVQGDSGGKLFGTGAWQVGLRYEHFDLANKGLVGVGGTGGFGEVDSITAGLNWFLNPNMKIQFNYFWAQRDNQANPESSGDVHGFGIRVASDW